MIIQPAFDIPPDLQKSLLSGDLIRYGGVVRDTAGRLVTYLEEVPTPEKALEKAVNSATLSLKNPWVTVGLGTGVLIAMGGVVVAGKKRKKDAEFIVPECVRNYRLSLESYLEAIQNGSLDPGTIDRLIADLDTVTSYSQENETSVAFSPGQLAKVTQVVVKYTRELAKVNPVELNETCNLGDTTDHDVVVDLRRHLETQRRIFDKAA